jgi:ubiquinone/menaquinone biosynthesis C-methylase UbiE
MHGLALLRSWPFGDPEQAEERMAAMRSILTSSEEPPTVELQAFETEIDDAYGSWATTYDEPNALIMAEERAMTAILDGFPPGSAVDVACGTGRITAHLRRRGHQVVGCDRSAAMLARASRNVDGIKVVQSDLRSLPFRDDSADLVSCSLALTHVPDLDPALRSFARVLRAGGSAVISDIHPLAVMSGAHAFFRTADGSRAVARNEQHWIGDYVGAALGAGFRIERCDEAFIDDELMREFGVEDSWLAPDRAVVGLPFALLWVLRLDG